MLLVLLRFQVVVYQTCRLLSSDKEYLRCTVRFTTTESKETQSFLYACEFSSSRIEGSIGILYRIEAHFKNKEM